jgi:hypothetical protein
MHMALTTLPCATALASDMIVIIIIDVGVYSTISRIEKKIHGYNTCARDRTRDAVRAMRKILLIIAR